MPDYIDLRVGASRAIKWISIKFCHTGKYIMNCLLVLFHSSWLAFTMLSLSTLALIVFNSLCPSDVVNVYGSRKQLFLIL